MASSDPARQQLVDSIVERFKTISTANGYRTNIGSKVFLWKVSPWDQKETTGLIVRDTSCTMVAQVSGHHDWTLQIEAEAYAVGESLSNALRSAEADIIQCIGVSPKWTVGDLQGRIETSSLESDIGIKHEEYLIGAIRIRFTVTFRTQLWSPEV